jgi:hypothetical protein
LKESHLQYKQKIFKFKCIIFLSCLFHNPQKEYQQQNYIHCILIIESLLNKSDNRISPNTIISIQTTPIKTKIKWRDNIEDCTLRDIQKHIYMTKLVV